MRLIYYAMAAPIIVLSAIVYFLVSTGALGQPDYSIAITLQTVAMIVVPSCLAGGYLSLKRRSCSALLPPSLPGKCSS
jgi:hypothetical protein